MTITVKFGDVDTRWGGGITFPVDKDDIRTMTWDYTGELGSDTISSVTATTKNITAATPVITANVVTMSMSGGTEGARASIDVEITTTAGDVISRLAYFDVQDF